MLYQANRSENLNKLVSLLLVGPLLALITLSLTGCDGGTASYTTPELLPIRVSLTIDQDGVWSCGAGLWTPVGTFSIGREFGSDRRASYVIIRDRSRGTDQVFRLSAAESLRIYAVGEHTIMLQPQRDRNKWVVETASSSGSLDFEIVYAAREIAFADCGGSNPRFGITSDRRICYEPSGWFSQDREFSVDSIRSITYYKNVGIREIRIDWKEPISDQPFIVSLSDDEMLDPGIDQLEQAINKIDKNVVFERESGYWWSVPVFAIVGFTCALIIIAWPMRHC